MQTTALQEGQPGDDEVQRLVHDLRNEVNVIGFAVTALGEQAGDAGPGAQRSLERIASAYERCAALLDELSRLEQGKDGGLPSGQG